VAGVPGLPQDLPADPAGGGDDRELHDVLFVLRVVFRVAAGPGLVRLADDRHVHPGREVHPPEALAAGGRYGQDYRRRRRVARKKDGS